MCSKLKVVMNTAVWKKSSGSINVFLLRVVANIRVAAIVSRDKLLCRKHQRSALNVAALSPLLPRQSSIISKRRKARQRDLQTERSPITIRLVSRVLYIRRGSQGRPHPQIGALLETGFMRLLRLFPDLSDLILNFSNLVLVSSAFVVRDLGFEFRHLLLVLPARAIQWIVSK